MLSRRLTMSRRESPRFTWLWLASVLQPQFSRSAGRRAENPRPINRKCPSEKRRSG